MATKKTPFDQVQVHEWAKTFPELSTDDFNMLFVDIMNNGVQVPLVFIKGTDILVDGVHRLKAWSKLDEEKRKPYPFTVISENESLSRVLSANARRRHMTESQRGMAAAKISKQSSVGRPSKDSVAITIEEAAAMLNVSVRTVKDARKTLTEGIPEINEAVEQGHLAVSDAAKASGDLSPDEQRKALEEYKTPTGDLPTIGKDTITAAHRRVVRTEQAEMETPPLPEDQYRVVVIDPPWPVEQKAAMRGAQGGLEYAPMDIHEIVELDVPSVLHKDAWVFLWTTHKFLPTAIQMFEDFWELEYYTTMVWHKPGGPQIMGGPCINTEFIVVGKKGQPRFADTKAFRTTNEWKRGKHSAKPQEFYELLDRVCDVKEGDALDMFNRRVINSKWEGWGLESPSTEQD